jgi:hypothetical protein
VIERFSSLGVDRGEVLVCGAQADHAAVDLANAFPSLNYIVLIDDPRKRPVDFSDLPVKTNSGSLHKPPFEKGAFDAVVGLFVLSRAKKTDQALGWIRHALKPPGALLLFEPPPKAGILKRFSLPRRLPEYLRESYKDAMDTAHSPEHIKIACHKMRLFDAHIESVPEGVYIIRKAKGGR